MGVGSVIQTAPRGVDIDITALVKEDLEERAKLGQGRYGERLRPFNGRDALIDAYQEALDLACYLRQAIYEREHERGCDGR